jgi:hypothetical protein
MITNKLLSDMIKQFLLFSYKDPVCFFFELNFLELNLPRRYGKTTTIEEIISSGLLADRKILYVGRAKACEHCLPRDYVSYDGNGKFMDNRDIWRGQSSYDYVFFDDIPDAMLITADMLAYRIIRYSAKVVSLKTTSYNLQRKGLK